MNIVASKWHDSFERVLGLVYPSKCALCGLLADSSPCVTCQGEMLPNPVTLKPEREGPLQFSASIYPYQGRAGQAVRRLKFARSTSLAHFMSATLAQTIHDLTLEAYEVVPVPIHWSRRCSRGFNQSELLCECLRSRAELLRRHRRTRPQVGLNREQRLRNLAGAFSAAPDAAGCRILLVDDVLTSGQTARECARTLVAAGALEVGVLAFCGDPNERL